MVLPRLMASNMTSERIESHPILDWDRGKSFLFSFNGKEIIAYENETIAMALHAAGIYRFSRSFKYYRPRGIYCASGYCNSCAMRVDGIPNTRTCITQAKKDMIVETQDKKPWYSFLFLPVIRNFGRIFSTGFQYHKFTRPRIVKMFFEKTTRQFAGSGEVPEFESNVEIEFEKQSKLETELLIIGGGIAGLSAALIAAKTGVKVILAEEKNYLGGNLSRQTHEFSDKLIEQFDIENTAMRGFEIIEELTSQLKELENVQLMPNSQITSFFDEGVFGLMEKIEGAEKFHLVIAQKTIIATGAYERSVIFEYNDLPGIMTGNAIQTLIHIYGVKPSKKVIIIAPEKIGFILARNFLHAGISIEALIVLKLQGERTIIIEKADRPGVPIFEDMIVTKAYGKDRFKGVETVSNGVKQKIAGDLLCIVGGYSPAHELAQQIGAKMKFCKALGGLIPLRKVTGETTIAGIFVAGNVAGIGGAYTSTLEGKIAALAVSDQLGKASKNELKELKKTFDILSEEREKSEYNEFKEGLAKVLLNEKSKKEKVI
ncbi:MAG: 2Fe-2S iron-sulfur cluster-binding protein [Candidatus Kariarchaeaceae archaeon]